MKESTTKVSISIEELTENLSKAKNSIANCGTEYNNIQIAINEIYTRLNSLEKNEKFLDTILKDVAELKKNVSTEEKKTSPNKLKINRAKVALQEVDLFYKPYAHNKYEVLKNLICLGNIKNCDKD